MTDYSLTMKDGTGRTCELNINADSIAELVRDGYSADEAQEIVEGNAFQNAIARGEIGTDAWLI